MIGDKKVLAVIPARGGSKGLPGKNIKVLCGKPLIVWTIDVALKSNYIDELFVSTDSQQIAGQAVLTKSADLGSVLDFKDLTKFTARKERINRSHIHELPGERWPVKFLYVLSGVIKLLCL